MQRFWIVFIAGTLFLVAVTEVALSDPAAEKYVDDAVPFMYHSCKSVVDEASGDDAYIDKVVRSLAAVSLYNRDVEISTFAISEGKKTAMHDKFVEALKKGCKKTRMPFLPVSSTKPLPMHFQASDGVSASINP